MIAETLETNADEIRYSNRAKREAREIQLSDDFVRLMVFDIDNPLRLQTSRPDGTFGMDMIDIHLDMSEDNTTILAFKRNSRFTIFNCRSQWRGNEKADQSTLRDLFAGLVLSIPGESFRARRNTYQRIHTIRGGFLPLFEIRYRSSCEKEFHYFERKR